MDAVEQQGGMPEPANREQRRRQEKLNQANKPRGGSAPSASGTKRGKRR
jgi:hypothetical protein